MGDSACDKALEKVKLATVHVKHATIPGLVVSACNRSMANTSFMSRCLIDHPVPMPQGSAEEKEQASMVLQEVLEAARVVAVMLCPIVPSFARLIYLQLGFTDQQFEDLTWEDAQWGGEPWANKNAFCLVCLAVNRLLCVLCLPLAALFAGCCTLDCCWFGLAAEPAGHCESFAVSNVAHWQLFALKVSDGSALEGGQSICQLTATFRHALHYN